MGNEAKPVQVEPPKVSRPRPRSPNADKIMDRLMESIGIERNEGGSA